MFAVSDTYEDIFKERARQYHYAMATYPNARNEEFVALFKGLAPFSENENIADLPSGGGYLSQYLSVPGIYS